MDPPCFLPPIAVPVKEHLPIRPGLFDGWQAAGALLDFASVCVPQNPDICPDPFLVYGILEAFARGRDSAAGCRCFGAGRRNRMAAATRLFMVCGILLGAVFGILFTEQQLGKVFHFVGALLCTNRDRPRKRAHSLFWENAPEMQRGRISDHSSIEVLTVVRPVGTGIHALPALPVRSICSAAAVRTAVRAISHT